MRRWHIGFLALLLFLCLTGCAGLQTETPGYRIYATNAEHTRLQTEILSTQSIQVDDILDEMFARLITPASSSRSYSTTCIIR